MTTYEEEVKALERGVRLLKLELRRQLGRTLQRCAERVLHEPCFVHELRGDALTRAAISYGVHRRTDAQLRKLVQCAVGACSADTHKITDHVPECALCAPWARRGVS